MDNNGIFYTQKKFDEVWDRVAGKSDTDADTLKTEYLRDKNLGLPIDVPKNYFPDDDDTKEPVVRWRSCANLLYSNWLNYFVYQTTPYDLSEIKK